MNNFKKFLVCSLAAATIGCGVAGVAFTPKAYAAEVPTITGANVSLNENIVLKFHIDDYTADYAAKFTFDGKEYDATVENGIAEFGLVTPQYLDKEVTLSLTKDGAAEIKASKSVKSYLETLVNTSDATLEGECEINKYAKLKTLAVDMLNYSAEAQKKYLSDGEYTLVNAGLTDEQKALATTFAAPSNDAAATLNGEKSDAFSWISAGIRFDYNVSLYFVIKPANAGTVLKLEVNGEILTAYETLESGDYKFRYDKVNVVDFADAYTVKVLDEENNAIGQSLSYSVNSYVLAKYADESMGGITKAVYNYGVSAVAYDAVKDGHNYDKAELLNGEGNIAEVLVKPDFDRKNYTYNPAYDDLDYTLDCSTAKLVCKNCSHKKEVEFSLAEPEKEYTKDDTTANIIVDGKTYSAPIKVLYAKVATSSLEVIDEKIYFVNTFEVKGYTADEIYLFTENGKVLKKDIVDTSVEGRVTFKTDITDFDGNVLPADGNKTQAGAAYGLGVSLRNNANNVASSNQNGDVCYVEWDKDYEILLGDNTYRSGKYWHKVAVMVETTPKGPESATFVKQGDDVYMEITFKNTFREQDVYRMFLEIGADTYREFSEEEFTSIIDGNDLIARVKLTNLDEASSYIHFTKDGSGANRYSNLYPLPSFVDCSAAIDGKYYTLKSLQYGLNLRIMSGSTELIPLDGGIMRYVNKGKGGQALEFNRCYDEKGFENLSNGFVDHILFTMYRKDDEDKTAVGSFKLVIISGSPYLVTEKNGKDLQFFVSKDGGKNTQYDNMYRMVENEDSKAEFNTFLKTALWGEELAGDYCLTAQVKVVADSPLSDGDVYVLPTDDNHTFTIV